MLITNLVISALAGCTVANVARNLIIKRELRKAQEEMQRLLILNPLIARDIKRREEIDMYLSELDKLQVELISKE